MSMLLVTDEGVEEESEPLPEFMSAKEQGESVEGVNFSLTLTSEQQSDCHQLLGQFDFQFSLIPVLIHQFVYDKDTGDSPPVKSKMYRLSDKVTASIKEEVSKMLVLEVNEPFNSPWSSLVLLVPKAAPPGALQNLHSV